MCMSIALLLLMGRLQLMHKSTRPGLVLVHEMQGALGRGVVTHVHVDRPPSINGKAKTHG